MESQGMKFIEVIGISEIPVLIDVKKWKQDFNRLDNLTQPSVWEPL